MPGGELARLPTGLRGVTFVVNVTNTGGAPILGGTVTVNVTAGTRALAFVFSTDAAPNGSEYVAPVQVTPEPAPPLPGFPPLPAPIGPFYLPPAPFRPLPLPPGATLRLQEQRDVHDPANLVVDSVVMSDPSLSATCTVIVAPLPPRLRVAGPDGALDAAHQVGP